MKQQVSITESGVQIENTLSMALQNRNRSRKKGLLLLVAFIGVFSSIFTFLSMFSPAYSLPVLIAVMLVLFLFFSYCAMKPRSGFVPVLVTGLVYCGLFFWQRECISNGLMYFTNTICQTIYMTDWEYFMMESTYSEINSVTCVLCFLVFPIIWMLCFAVLRYQNFFLSLLVTFPFVEIGLFFGIVPNHGFALSLIAFWFTMMAVQLASSGITHTSKTGFLRRKNTFFPVSNMRFMLSEDTGIAVLSMLLILLMLSEGILHVIDYERPEKVKQLRTDFQNYVASLDWTGKTILENYGDASSDYDENQELITLGAVDEKIYENAPMTSIAFSQNPNSRVYLKYRTGHVYNGTNWTILPEDIYQNSSQVTTLQAFQELQYHPAEFLYYTAPEQYDIQMTMYHTTGVLSQCIPYGFQKNEAVFCDIDEIATETTSYVLAGGAEYEEIFMNPDSVASIGIAQLLNGCHDSAIPVLSELLEHHENDAVWLPNHSQLSLHYYGDSTFTAGASEAGILCGAGYDDFVYEHETYLPDTPDMQAVRTAYADIFTGFDAETATPSEIIAKLQEIRNQICNEVFYTLAPGKTPVSRDHVAYFLLENKKGYCEHYATAGTVLARMAGIPARYCEGYMIDCSRSGTLSETESDGNIAYVSEILDSNAHAWTEIYINGIGWIPFEFTFSYFKEPSRPAETYVMPEEASLFPTESAPPATSVTPTESATAEEIQETKEISSKLMMILLVLTILAISCIIILIFRIARLIAIRKHRARLTQENREQASRYAYQYLTNLMSECGVHTRSVTIGELIEESEKLCADYTHSQYSLSMAIQIGAKLRYSPHPLSSGELHYLNHTANALAEGMYQKSKFFKKFYLKWLRHYL